MNIGETITTLPVLDAPVGAAAAAPAEDGEAFAERLAAALGDGGGAALPKAGAAVLAEGAPPVPAGAALLSGQVAKAAKVAVAPLDVASAAPLAVTAASVVETAMVEGPEVNLQASVPSGQSGGDIPDADAAMAVDAGSGAAVARDVVEDATLDAPEGEGETSEFAAAALPVTLPVVAPVPVAVMLAAPVDAASAEGVSADEVVAPVGGAKRGAAPVVPVSVMVEGVASHKAAPMPAGDARAVPAAATGGDVPTEADGADEAPVAEAAAVRGKAKADAPVLLAEPVAARTVDPAVAAPVAAAQKAVAEVELTADPAAPVASQMPQALPQTSERAVAQPLRTDQPGWERVLSERIAAELSEDGQEIELSLAPEKLGPLRIKLEMVDGLAQVKFITATPEAARVFTEAQHRLTEGMARAGVDLGQQSAQSAGGQGAGGRQGGQADDQSAPRGRMNEFLTHSRRIEAGDAPALRRAGAGLVNLMA